MARHDVSIAAAIAIAVAFSFLAVDGNRHQAILDEGIYLDGAVRILAGEAPYRDFFALTGPGCFWLVAAVFRLLGVSLEAARWIPAIEIGFMTGAVYWLAARFTSVPFAALTTVIFLGFEAANPGLIQVNHRMDSAALALAAAVLAIAGRWTACGAAAAAAAWCTPPVVIVGVALGWWARAEGHLGRWVRGAAIVSTTAAAALAWQGALFPMIERLYWTTVHYSGPNRSMYGDIVGGWPRLLAELSGVQAAIAVYLLGLPALLPAFVLLGFALRAWDTREKRCLAFCAIALVLSAYPRAGAANLRLLGALPLLLSAMLLYRTRVWKPVSILALVLAVASIGSVAARLREGRPVATARGTVRMSPDAQQLYNAISGRVRPGDTMIAFPYEPVWVFLAGARNPIPYSFLQPGMMTPVQEAEALGALVRKTPRWVLYLDAPPEAFLRIWPASDPERLRFPRIEDFLRVRYRPVVNIPQSNGAYQLLESVRQ